MTTIMRQCALIKTGKRNLNRGKTESNLYVPEIQGCHENALYENFEISHLDIGGLEILQMVQNCTT